MKPRLVILTSRFPYPLTKGDRLRIFHQIRELSHHFELFVICINEGYPQQIDYDALRPYCSSVTVHLLSRRQRLCNIGVHLLSGSEIPMQVRYFYDRLIHAQIKEEIKYISPDYIHVHLIRMAPYVHGMPESIGISIDYMDSMVLNDLAGQYLKGGIRQIFRNKERRLVQAYELEIFQRYTKRFIISARDKANFPASLRHDLHILPNGVDTTYFHLNQNGVTATYDLVFCGNLSYRPNRQAVEALVSQILPSLPQYTCLIAGAELPQALCESPLPHLTTLGYQEDIRSVYWSGRLMVVPILEGSGQQNKVLEAMASGTPCVITSFVNEAIGAEDGTEVMVVDDIRDFESCIKALLSQPEKMEDMRQRARTFVVERYSWHTNTQILIESIKEDLQT